MATEPRAAREGLTPGCARYYRAAQSLVSASLDSIVKRVEAGEGTLGKLVNDDAAHDEFLAAVKEVRGLVEEIRDNPKSFIKVSLF